VGGRFPPRVRAGGRRAPGRAPRSRVQFLGTVRGHVVLSPGAGAVLARDLRRTGRQRRQVAAPGVARCAQALHPGLCQRQRWQIELFFKALKQNLRIKTFVGTSANALQIQVWTALIALLLLKYLQLRARFGWSLSNLAALLRQQLFVYRDLFSWIDQPFQPPPQLAHLAEQIPLSW